MRNTKLIPVLGAVMAALITTGSVSAAELPRTNLKLIGSPISSPNWVNILKPFWLDRVPEMSGGQITVDGISMTEVGVKGPEMLRLAKAGVADLVAGSTTLVSGELPENDGIDLAGLIQNTETLQKVVDAYLPTLRKLYEEKVGVTPIGFWPTGAQVFWCATPIGGLQDLQGKKVRVFSATTANFVESIGAVPVTLAFSEVVPALQRNVIDCALTGANSGNIAKWTDVATHIYPLVVGWGVNFVVANTRSWNNLDPNVREFLEKHVKDDMVPAGWKMAQDATQHGIWCSVGDDRCDVDATAPKKLEKRDLTLVPVTEEDEQALKNLIAKSQLPEFAERCGESCIRNWNETVGKVVDVTAPVSQ